MPVNGQRIRGLRDALPIRDKYTFSLADLKLAKGDQLKLTLEAVDFRGNTSGKSTMSEPLVLHVTDQSGILSAMAESDQRSAQQLGDIISRQLGIGGRP